MRRQAELCQLAAAVAAISLAAGCAAQTMPAGGAQPATRHNTAPPGLPVITAAAAASALARYAAEVSRADMLRSSRLLAAVEAGSSYQLDAGAYRFSRVADPGDRGYQALRVSDPVLYIPRGPGAGQWWAATAEWIRPRETSSPPVPALLVFRKARGTWMQVLEPDTVGRVPGPAQPAAAATGRALAVAPQKLPALTVSHLNALAAAGPRCPRPGLCRPHPRARIAMPRLGTLSDLHDQAFWARRLPAGSADTDLHSQVHSPVYVIDVRGAGDLVFYDVRAVLHLAPPAGYTLRLAVPGFVSAAAPRSQVTLTYTDQFAAYDPPRGAGPPRVVAEAAGPVAAHG